MRLRSFVITLSLVLMLGGILALWLGMDRPANPTGRRVSSELVPRQGTSQDIGATAEAILSRDLEQPRTKTPEGLCACQPQYAPTASPPPGCAVCLANFPIVARTNYRIPDFVVPGEYIAESKNSLEINSNRTQIADYVHMAETLDVPMWLYVRTTMQATIDPTLVDEIRATGGDVVRYFRTNPSEPVPLIVTQVQLLGIGGLVLGLILLVFAVFLWPTGRTRTPPAPSTPKGPLAEAADFADKSKDSAQERIDREDSRWEG